MKRPVLKTSLMLAMPGLALAACNSQPVVHAENASVAEVAAKAKAAVKMQPGQWTSRIELIELDMPGIKDKAMLDGMKQAMQRSQEKGVTQCITPEMASRPPEKMFAGRNGGDCRYDHFNMAAGRMDGKMTCKGPNGGAMTMDMSGSFTSTSYDITSAMKVGGGPNPGGEMKMKARVRASRTGECTGAEDVKATPPVKG